MTIKLTTTEESVTIERESDIYNPNSFDLTINTMAELELQGRDEYRDGSIYFCESLSLEQLQAMRNIIDVAIEKLVFLGS